MRSLRWRFIFPYIAILALILAGLAYDLPRQLREYTLGFWRENLLAEARLVAGQSLDLFQAGSVEGQNTSAAQEYARLLGVRVTLIRADGVVIADSEADPQSMDNHASRPEVRTALQGQEGVDERPSGTTGAEMLYAASPVMDAGRVVGVARLSVPLSNVRAQLASIQRSSVGFVVLVIALAVALTLLLTEFTIRPLRELTSAVEQMRGGSFAGVPHHGRGDEIAALGKTFNEMSAQLRTKMDELETERKRLDSVLENMTDGVLIVDHDGAVKLMNPAAARIMRINPEQSQNKTLIEVTRQHQLVEIWKRSLQDGRQHTATLETGQSRAFVQAIASPLGDSTAGSTLLLLQDLTRLRRLETVRRDFISNVSHELRTPLAGLKAMAETLQEGALEDPPAARRFLERMDAEIDTLIQLVQELLELARIESGRVPLEKVTIPPAELVHRSVERMAFQAERAGLRLTLDVPEHLPAVSADPTRLEQVLVNLLHNAIKFTPPGGEITVSAYEQEQAVIFVVRDTGTGIDPETLPRIFERFYKSDRARSGGGTGLGLSIARHMVEAHGGRIWAESEPGAGSAFFFSLPIA